MCSTDTITRILPLIVYIWCGLIGTNGFIGQNVGVGAWTTDILPKLYIKYGKCLLCNLLFYTSKIIFLENLIEQKKKKYLYISLIRSREKVHVFWKSNGLFPIIRCR